MEANFAVREFSSAISPKLLIWPAAENLLFYITN